MPDGYANPDWVRGLVREREVHRDVYTSPAVFDLEMARLFARTWVYVGHASQVPEVGDYFTTTVGVQPVVMVRDHAGIVRVLHNRCPHKGTKVAWPTNLFGNAGRFFRCPYHAWAFPHRWQHCTPSRCPAGYAEKTAAFNGTAAPRSA